MKCDCCGYSPTPAKKVFKHLKKFRDGSTLGKPGELGMADIKGPGKKKITVCLQCWGEIMKIFGRAVRESYINLPFYDSALTIIKTIKSGSEEKA